MFQKNKQVEWIKKVGQLEALLLEIKLSKKLQLAYKWALLVTSGRLHQFDPAFIIIRMVLAINLAVL